MYVKRLVSLIQVSNGTRSSGHRSLTNLLNLGSWPSINIYEIVPSGTYIANTSQSRAKWRLRRVGHGLASVEPTLLSPVYATFERRHNRALCSHVPLPFHYPLCSSPAPSSLSLFLQSCTSTSSSYTACQTYSEFTLSLKGPFSRAESDCAQQRRCCCQ